MAKWIGERRETEAKKSLDTIGITPPVGKVDKDQTRCVNVMWSQFSNVVDPECITVKSFRIESNPIHSNDTAINNSQWQRHRMAIIKNNHVPVTCTFLLLLWLTQSTGRRRSMSSSSPATISLRVLHISLIALRRLTTMKQHRSQQNNNNNNRSIKLHVQSMCADGDAGFDALPRLLSSG